MKCLHGKSARISPHFMTAFISAPWGVTEYHLVSPNQNKIRSHFASLSSQNILGENANGKLTLGQLNLQFSQLRSHFKRQMLWIKSLHRCSVLPDPETGPSHKPDSGSATLKISEQITVWARNNNEQRSRQIGSFRQWFPRRMGRNLYSIFRIPNNLEDGTPRTLADAETWLKRGNSTTNETLPGTVQRCYAAREITS